MDKKVLKEKIISSITDMKEKIITLEEITQPIAPENSLGRISRMDAINNKSVAEATLRTARRKMSKLKMALSKIDNSDFGKCQRCGGEIPEARLMFLPESSHCLRCAR